MKLLIVIDMVKGFVEEGTLASPSIKRIIPENVRLVDKFLNEGNQVIFIRDTHNKDAREFNLYAPHCVEGTNETELVDELKVYEDRAKVYRKNSTNFMFAPNFIEDLNKYEDLSEIVLAGCLSEVCVKNGGISLVNYLDQINSNIKVYVDKSGIDTYDAPNHSKDEITNNAIKEMEKNGIICVERYGE